MPSIRSRSPLPALVLVALGLVARLVATPLLVVIERLAAAGRGILPVLPARQLARRTGTISAALLVVVLGSASVVFAASLALGNTRADDLGARFATGGDVRVSLSNAGRDEVDPSAQLARDYAALPGVDAVVAASVGTVTIGGQPYRMVATDPAALPELDPRFASISRQFDTPTSTTPGTVGVVLTSGLAARLAAAPGDEILIEVPGLPDGALGVVVGTVDRLPIVGASGLLVDASALEKLDGRLCGRRLAGERVLARYANSGCRG